MVFWAASLLPAARDWWAGIGAADHFERLRAAAFRPIASFRLGTAGSCAPYRIRSRLPRQSCSTKKPRRSWPDLKSLLEQP